MLEVILGAIISILISIFIENLRKPKLSIRIEPPVDVQYNNRSVTHTRFLRVEVINHPLPKWARWLSREAATQVHGTVSFYHLDGQNVFGRFMQGRWSSTPEPVLMKLFIDGKDGYIIDPLRLTVHSRVEIDPDQIETLDIAVKFDDDSECYGWCNDNYFSKPYWRNPEWKLNPDRYLVRVVISTAGEKTEKVFRLINDVTRANFRLEEKMESDKVLD